MQKDFMMDTWEDVKQCAVGEKAFLFGAGFIGRNTYEDMNKYATSWDVVGFLDNDISKQGMKMKELTIYSPDVLKEYASDEVLVLICCFITAGISRQLYEMGIENYYTVCRLEWPRELRIACWQGNINDCDVEWLLNRVEDERSRVIVKNIVEKRKAGFFDYTDLWKPEASILLTNFLKEKIKKYS